MDSATICHMLCTRRYTPASHPHVIARASVDAKRSFFYDFGLSTDIISYGLSVAECFEYCHAISTLMLVA